eukprot:CAMPEP_0113939314 /NCGR_PEP_ID=MMETSP1339-20121228/5646_1 /TAXON_ID=94617 /ORGANISM="Fibrocapsa japonica" /LENGTH=536 /DNA_ID=CAMNT_0000942783 /DNA_START=145 /DNA_END=1755 /DNA_ORIENTATION=- /assembly_acc=CAM_ASM_000762
MLVLFETSAGFALFKVVNEGKLNETAVEDLWKEFETPEKASKMVKLKAFSAFSNTAEAVAAAAGVVEGKLSKGLKKFLSKAVVKKGVQDQMAVIDSKLGGLVKDKLDIQCVNDSKVMELMRGVRQQMETLLSGVSEHDMRATRLGLSHSLSRYKLKFSADKVDTMVVQAIGLLDELDKEINTYAMRVKEWYGWHFPEMAKVVGDNLQYSRCILLMGTRDHAKSTDFSSVLEDDSVEKALKASAEVSMGTEINDIDVASIKALADQVVSLSEYRVQLYDYLKNRMQAIAPNLTILVGELVGARLLAHAGSLLNLAKHPASTIQILGAEKALFRALKTKHDTPKYGLIYHASLIGQTSNKNKGKISRVLAAKCALGIRMDALGEVSDTSVGFEGRQKVEMRIRMLEGGARHSLSGGGKAHTPLKKYDGKAVKAEAGAGDHADADDVVDAAPSTKKKKKKDKDKTPAKQKDGEEEAKSTKKKKKDKGKTPVKQEDEEGEAKSAKKKKRKLEDEEDTPQSTEESAKKKKKKKKKAESDDA